MKLKSRLFLLIAVALLCTVLSPLALADEGGVSVWLPGQFGSLAAAPGEPGWSLPMVYYHPSAGASGGANFEVGGRIAAILTDSVAVANATARSLAG
jgi:hypothetical protein